MNQKNNIDFFADIRLPKQDLSTLSFCRGNKPSRVQAWAESLPATRIVHTSAALYKALPELAHLKTSPATRIQMLEIVRPYVQQCIQGLSKELLSQSLTLPDNALKTAIVAQALQKHMTNAYIVAARDISNKIKKATDTQLPQLNLAIHRAVTGLGLSLLRSYQLYTPAPNQLWLEIHRLYRLAEEFKLLNTAIADPLLQQSQASSVQSAYFRTLLLASARPNQLRQTEVLSIYNVLESWSTQVTFNEAGKQHSENLFVVDLSRDMSPTNKQLLQMDETDDLRELDTRQLLSNIKKAQEDHQSIVIPRDITTLLLDHLTHSWQKVRLRGAERRKINATMEVTLGLTGVHFHAGNELNFKQSLSKPNSTRKALSENPYTSKPLSAEDDPWDNAFDADAHETSHRHLASNSSSKLSADEIPAIHLVEAIDASTEGYCLNWKTQVPLKVRAGELIGLKESGRQKWAVGVIRWIRQSHSTQIGVQILGQNAEALAASMTHADGEDSAYMRTLKLPAINSRNRPETLITTAVLFQERHKIHLNQRGKIHSAQLTQRLFSTNTISQFAFHPLEEVNTETDNENFDSEWGGL